MAPIGLSVYRLASEGLGPLANHILASRVRSQKEDPSRVEERRGIACQARREGQLVWFHAASVGESQIALAIAQEMLDQTPGLTALISSGTRTSAKLIEERGCKRIIHQFVPVDRPPWVKRFIAHWRPDLGVFVESELWPNLIQAARDAGTPLALINARMNEGSIRNWSRFKASARYILGQFDWIGAADQRTAEGLKSLGRESLGTIGNLKLDLRASAPDPAKRDALKNQIGTRPVLLAASTHAGEEGLICQAFAQLLNTHGDALLILVPRHPERAGDVIETLRTHGLGFTQRSTGVEPETGRPVYLADTLGEMSLWYDLSPVTLVCGSFVDGIGGHNPIEASQFDSTIITGPYTASFDDVFTAYDQHEARLVASTPAELIEAVHSVWSGKGPKAEQASAALQSLSGGAMCVTVSALMALINQEQG